MKKVICLALVTILGVFVVFQGLAAANLSPTTPATAKTDEKALPFSITIEKGEGTIKVLREKGDKRFAENLKVIVAKDMRSIQATSKKFLSADGKALYKVEIHQTYRKGFLSVQYFLVDPEDGHIHSAGILM